MCELEGFRGNRSLNEGFALMMRPVGKQDGGRENIGHQLLIRGWAVEYADTILKKSKNIGRVHVR